MLMNSFSFIIVLYSPVCSERSVPLQVPGLFEGDEYATLMTQCKEGAQKEGLMLDTHEELYKWFTSQVIRNLHVVFTMNPSSEGLKDRAATSPALFNRCVWHMLSSIHFMHLISSCFHWHSNP